MSGGTSSQANSVDIDKIVKSITAKLDSYWSTYDSDTGTNPCSIRRVPQHIREVDGNTYEPVVLSIGPYHHGSHSLTDMEREKWKCLNFILRSNCKITLQDYIRAICKLEKQARSYYYEDVKMTKKRFVQMLLLDACFILVKVDGTIISEMQSVNPHSASASQQILDGSVDEMAAMQQGHDTVCNKRIEQESALCNNLSNRIELTSTRANQMETGHDQQRYDYHAQYPHDQNTVGDWYAVSVWHDLFLLENQMPYFVIETVYELAVSNRMTKAPPLKEKMCECVQDIFCQFPNGILDSLNFHHLLHLCHMYFRPTEKITECHGYQRKVWFFHHLVYLCQKFFNSGSNSEENEQCLLPIQQKDFLRTGQLPSRWRQAVQYHEAGVQLKRRGYSNYRQHSLLDVRLKNETLEVPCLAIDENTESLFKNLIAFEQTDCQFGNDVTAYVAFMSQLVSTPADATLLAHQGIIVHMLGSDDEVSALFVRLTKDISFDFGSGYYLQCLCWILEAHYQNRLNRWMAWLWQKHFSNPWLALAVFAGVVVLFCTIVQTWFTVLAYVKPSG